MIGQEDTPVSVLPKRDEQGKIYYSESYPCCYVEKKEVGKLESWKSWGPDSQKPETD